MASKKPSIEGDTHIMPDDLTLDILSRQPIKSLCRFRCVSKRWSSLISDSRFGRMHLNRSSSTQSNKLKVIVSHTLIRNNFQTLDIETSMKSKHKFISPMPDRNLKFLCSCDGLVLLSCQGVFFLWNPSTRAHGAFLGSYQLKDDTLYGLCYDPLIDDYDVVFLTPLTSGSIWFFIVFSRNRKSYNLIMDFPYWTSCGGKGVIVNGALHWVVFGNTTKNSLPKIAIVYLDLAEKKLKEVPLPDLNFKLDLNFKRHSFVLDLVVMGGFLCIYSKPPGELAEVWAMKEYGVKESWIKMFIIPPEIGIARPLGFTKKGEIILRSGEKLLVCDSEGITWSVLLSNLTDNDDMATYVESIISLR